VHARASRARRALYIACLSIAALAINGYHPLSEDGGLYVAGIEYTLNPSLFPHYTAFVTEHLRFSVFARLLAGIVRGTHLPLMAVLLLAEFASLLLTFFAADQLLRRCLDSEAAQLSGMALLACWWTLPIAGTSLMLMDPYVTARSFSTPLSLLAIAFALDRWSSLHAPLLCALSLTAAALLHPLMAAYAVAFILVLRTFRARRRSLGLLALTICALGLATTLYLVSPPTSAPVIHAAISRYYWFLSQWQWYELAGLAGPLIVLATLLRARNSAPTKQLVQASIFIGLLSIAIALLFARESAPANLVARLQPLRVFLLLYAVMTLLVGGLLGDLFARSIARAPTRIARSTRAALPVIAFLGVAAVFFFVQRSIYPASPHIELPGSLQRHNNPWVQAFLWARTHTPANATFALDAKYVNEPGEDAQTFRAWSLRSALPDFSKDGGEAAITPSLAATWDTAATAQKGLSAEDDATRDQRILPLGATWMVLHSQAVTNHPCPYRNTVVKVCELR
jgi:hypothetical protein